MATTEAGATAESVVESATDFPPHLMTVDRYEQLVASGVFDPKSRVFLWQGRLVEKMTSGCPHVFVVSFFYRLFINLIPEGWYTLSEQPISIGGHSLPEPDISVVRGSLLDALHRRPTAVDVALIVEVADSSLALDSKPVLRAYAEAGIPVYWIVNLRHRRVEVYSEPISRPGVPSYAKRQVYGPGEEIPVILDGREVGRVAAKDILPEVD